MLRSQVQISARDFDIDHPKLKTESYETYSHTPIADTLQQPAAEGQMVEATSPSLELGSLPQLVRHPSKESKAEKNQQRRQMITKKYRDIFCLTIDYGNSILFLVLQGVSNTLSSGKR